MTAQFQTFIHTFTIVDTDTSGRIAFDMAQSDINVQFDNVGLYEGSVCGSPQGTRTETPYLRPSSTHDGQILLYSHLFTFSGF